jgi:uncharacterized protein (DUF433 family)
VQRQPHDLFQIILADKPSAWSSRALCAESFQQKQGSNMAILDWSQCPAAESVPCGLDGAWVFRNTRMPVSAVLEILEAGASIEEIIDQFEITRQQINEVLEFAARSLNTPPPAPARFPVDVYHV